MFSASHAAVVMVRKRRTGLPSAGEGSGSQESMGSGGQGGGLQQPAGRAQMPQQPGGGSGRSGGSSQRGGHGGGYDQGRSAGAQPHGVMVQQTGASPEYQGRGGAPQPHGGIMGPQQPGTTHYEYQGRGGPHPRGGMLPQQYPGGCRGGGQMAGGQGADRSSGPTRLLAPELHQATAQATYQASQPSTSSEPSLQLQPPTITFGQVEQQFQQLCVQGEDKPSQAVRSIEPASSSKSVRFPLRPGVGSFGSKCLVKANHFFAELPDKDLHQYDVKFSLPLP